MNVRYATRTAPMRKKVSTEKNAFSTVSILTPSRPPATCQICSKLEMKNLILCNLLSGDTKVLKSYREEVSFVLHDIARKNAIYLKNEVQFIR